LELASVAFIADGKTAHGGACVRLKHSTVPRACVGDGEAGIIENSEM
jgi:hypothetical protein